jgi:betaine-aldehyde dehydrogenase
MTHAAAIELKNPDQFFIGGEWVAPSSDSRIDVIMPSTEEVFFSIPEAQEADINRAVAAARTAFDHGPWPRMTPAERAPFLKAIGKGIRSRAETISQIWTSEMGVIPTFAMPQVLGAGAAFAYYAGLADTFPFIEHHAPMGGGTGLLVREPVGVVAAIIPWNAPIALMAVKLAPALLAGCTVVLKTSPEAPVDAYILAEIVQAAGLPAGVVNVVMADRAVSELLVRHPDVDKVSFTGSTAAGRRIASICGERIARYTLELGGKSAAVVLDDYDVGIVAEAISASTSIMTNQVCAALSRVIVPRQRHDDLVEALGSAMGRIKIGDPFDPATQMGPLAMRRQLDRVQAYIAKGVEQGATLASGGGRPKELNRGYFIEPTVFGNVDNRSVIAQEEIFGPVVSVIPADSEEHAIELANDSIFGLNSSVFTNDADRAFSVGRRLRAGTVGQNGFRAEFSIAFGGFKQSGIGREGGKEGLFPYLETKTIVLDAPPSTTN